MTTKAMILPEKVKATTIQSVTFTDGMVVTAEDLDTAMRYPASMLQTVLRSYFGCGVVCGLELDDTFGTAELPRWTLCIDPGLAVDCNGYPLELCGPVNLDLSPEACSAGYSTCGTEVHIAIRRTTHGEASGDACSCDTSGPHRQCSRSREHVKVKAFLEEELKALKPGLCKRPDRPADTTTHQPTDQTGPAAESGTTDSTSTGDSDDGTGDGDQQRPNWVEACKCLTACSDCVCTDESWVFLGTVTVNKEEGIVGRDLAERKYVKPIECFCADILNKVMELEDRLDSYQGQVDPV